MKEVLKKQPVCAIGKQSETLYRKTIRNRTVVIRLRAKCVACVKIENAVKVFL